MCSIYTVNFTSIAGITESTSKGERKKEGSYCTESSDKVFCYFACLSQIN